METDEQATAIGRGDRVYYSPAGLSTTAQAAQVQDIVDRDGDVIYHVVDDEGDEHSIPERRVVGVLD